MSGDREREKGGQDGGGASGAYLRKILSILVFDCLAREKDWIW